MSWWLRVEWVSTSWPEGLSPACKRSEEEEGVQQKWDSQLPQSASHSVLCKLTARGDNLNHGL